MFTGIIESLGKVVNVRKDFSNLVLDIESKIGSELKVDQSISHNGVCLTVTEVKGMIHSVTAIEETLSKSTLKKLIVGSFVNLERCMLSNGRFDGHIVQGHVDQTATCTSIEDKNGSWLFSFEYDSAMGNITVEKGSVTVNGVSLTCFNSKVNGFTVAIIPYTFEHTNFQSLKVDDEVNLEFDIIGKYVQRIMSNR